MVYDNICTKKQYTKANGETKTVWLQVGTLKTNDDGSRFIELNLFPNLSLYVFERKEKEEKAHPPSTFGQEAPF